MTNQPSDDEKPFYSKAGFLLAAAFVTVVAVIGVVLALTGGGDEDDPPDEAATSPASTERAPVEDTSQPSLPPDDAELTSSAPPPAEGDCPPLSGDAGQDALATGPDVQWHPVGEMAPAFSDTQGPAVRDGIKECFAHTPGGALLAGYNFLADIRTAALDPVEVIEERVDPTAPIYESLLSYAGAERQLISSTVVAYRFLSSTENQATIAFVHQVAGTTEAQYLRDEVSLAWTGDDWLVIDIPDPQQVDSIPGDFVPWGPRLGDPE